MGAGQLGGRGATAEGERQLELVAQQLEHAPRAPASPPPPGPRGPAGRPAPRRPRAPARSRRRRRAGCRRRRGRRRAPRPRRPTSGRASAVARQRSSWRPPWLETTTPAAPCSTASAASSAVSTPLTSTGTAVGGELLEVGPAQRRLHQAEGLLDRHRTLRAQCRFDAWHAELLGDLEPGAQVALAVAPARRIDRHHDRLEAGLDRLLHQRLCHALVLEAVELKPASSAGRRLGDRAAAASWPGSRGTSPFPRRRRPAPSPPPPPGRPTPGRRPGR